jgi:hypothetical protein
MFEEIAKGEGNLTHPCIAVCMFQFIRSGAAPPARILHDHASGDDSIDDIVRALENSTVRDLHVWQLDLSGTKPVPRRTTAPRAQLAPAGAFRFVTHDNVLQPNNVATAGCLRGAGGHVKPGTRAWDGLLEALRANLIDALFLNGMFFIRCLACTAAPGCTPLNGTQPTNLTDRVCAQASETARAAGGVACGVLGAACASAGIEHGVVV